MFELTARNLPAPRYFLSYTAARAHARELGLTKRQYCIKAVAFRPTPGA